MDGRRIRDRRANVVAILRIRLLGALDVRDGDASLPPIESARAESLVAHLLPARREMIRSGIPVWVAEEVVGVFRELCAGVNAQATDVVRVLTGRDPRGLAEYLREVV